MKRKPTIAVWVERIGQALPQRVYSGSDPRAARIIAEHAYRDPAVTDARIAHPRGRRKTH